MNQLKKINIYMRKLFLAIVFVGICLPAYAQLKEPPVKKVDLPKTPLKEGFSNRIGGGLMLNNFSVGLEGLYAHSLGPYTELTFSLGITGIRDPSEQKLTNFFTGQRIVPNKYNRALGVPLRIGIKRRIFPRRVADNFRFFAAASAGPALGIVFPYLDDRDNNGYRTFSYIQVGEGLYQKIANEGKRGFFGALGEANTQFGAAGNVKVGMDLGKSFKHQFTLSVGFFFYYFKQGIQILDPKRPIIGNDGLPKVDSSGEVITEHAYDTKQFFATPQITFTYSGWW